MKKIIILSVFFIFSLVFSWIVSASEISGPKLGLKILTPVQDNSYFICIHNVGCLSVLAANQGKQFPIFEKDMLSMKKIFVLNRKTGSIHFQALDASCQTEIGSNQTMVLLGKIKVDNRAGVLEDSHCVVKERV